MTGKPLREVRDLVVLVADKDMEQVTRQLLLRQVIVRRRGSTVILEPLPDADDWTGFCDRIERLACPIRRG